MVLVFCLCFKQQRIRGAVASVKLPPHGVGCDSVSHWRDKRMALPCEAYPVVGVGVSCVGGERPTNACLVGLRQQGATLCVIGYPMRRE